MLHKCVRLLASVGLAALFAMALPSPALAQGYLGPNLRPFAVLAGTTVTCTGASALSGNIGVSPGSATTGFPVPCPGVPIIPPASDPAQLELTTAYTTLAALPCSSTVGPDLTGLTLVAGVYCVNAAASNLTGTLTLDGQGNPNAVWVFRMSASLITSSGSTVSVINSGNACGVQWQVSSSATIGTGTTFVGNILALTSITMSNGASLAGRALARNGTVTLDNNNIVNFGACGAGGGASGAPPPFISLSPATLPNGAGGVPFSQTLTGSGGIAPFTFTVTAGALPAGLTLSSAGTFGLLSGTPTTPGTFTFTIRGTDATGAFVDQAFTMVINGAVPTLPQAFVVLLALGLTAVGYFRLRRRARAE